MKFIYQYDDNSPLIQMELQRNATLKEVLEAFEDFLRGCGYYFQGELDIADERWMAMEGEEK